MEPTARPAIPADLDAVVELFLVSDGRLQDEPDTLREYLEWIWGLPYVLLARDTHTLRDTTGIVGFAQCFRDPDAGGPVMVDWCVGDRVDFASTGAALLDWSERRRREHAHDEPIRTSIVATDERARVLLEARGFAQVRTSWDMVRSLTPADRNPETAGIRIRAFRPGRDEHTLYHVHESAFRDHWDFVDRPYESFAGRMFGDQWDPSLVFLAEIDRMAAGVLVAIGFEGRGYVASLGVLREFRGRGVATALLRRAFAELEARGQERVELSVDAASSTGAVSLYEGLGMRAVRSYAVFDGPAG